MRVGGRAVALSLDNNANALARDVDDEVQIDRNRLRVDGAGVVLELADRFDDRRVDIGPAADSGSIAKALRRGLDGRRYLSPRRRRFARLGSMADRDAVAGHSSALEGEPRLGCRGSWTSGTFIGRCPRPVATVNSGELAPRS